MAVTPVGLRPGAEVRLGVEPDAVSCLGELGSMHGMCTVSMLSADSVPNHHLWSGSSLLSRVVESCVSCVSSCGVCSNSSCGRCVVG